MFGAPLLASTALWAQHKADILGTVTDSSGAVIRNAKVVVSNPDKGFYCDMKSNMLALRENSATPTLPDGGSADLYKAFLPYFETTESIGLHTPHTVPNINDRCRRVGFAFRAFGKNTILRAGHGIYYNYNIQPSGAGEAQNIPFQAAPAQNANTALPGNPTSTFLPDITVQNPLGAASVPIPLHPTVILQQRDFVNAAVQQWNITLQHQIKQNWIVRRSYVGSQLHHLLWYRGEINQPLVQLPNKTNQQQRPFQPWGRGQAIRSGAKQNFDQFQLESIKRLSNGSSFQVENNWTRSLDNADVFFGPQQWHFPNLAPASRSIDRAVAPARSALQHAGTGSAIFALPRPVRLEPQTLRLDKDGRSDLFRYRETLSVTL